MAHIASSTSGWLVMDDKFTGKETDILAGPFATKAEAEEVVRIKLMGDAIALEEAAIILSKLYQPHQSGYHMTMAASATCTLEASRITLIATA